ncbi:LOW QUALITY PROTEIN: peroxidasin-like [Anopheles albimanus]|uniref:LOW QUALITY PROTEIN: peroxidasin-like n=1 Tax=Anopheles albimanus TaxID=7167 RepID=UPI0016412344|nr:LOW QUALITY PROTEIN: peroxidasin-like [Anopheles albimanus]
MARRHNVRRTQISGRCSGSLLLIAVIALVCIAMTTVEAAGCPSMCSCQQRTVRCVKQQLDNVPEMPADTSIIDLRYNHIREVHSGAFDGLQHLHTIFLNENQLTKISSGAFRNLPSLKYLYLNRNRISTIAPDAFVALNRLHSMYLHFNNLSTMEPQTFTNMPSLERLYLHGNQIKHLPEGSFERLPSLRRLRLDGNALECDCSLLWFVRTMQQPNRKALVDGAACTTPATLEGQPISAITEDDFHCAKPEIIVEPRDIEISYGQTAVFSCKTTGDPKPSISWFLEEQPLKESADGRTTFLPDGSLRIDEVVPSDAGQYRCSARNALGSVRSRNARLTVNNEVVESEAEAPKFLQTPANQHDLLEGDPVVLDCVVTGAPTPSILWKFNGENIQNGRIKLFGNGSLILPMSTLDDGGIYTCYAGNALGNISVNVTVIVNARLPTLPAALASATSPFTSSTPETDSTTQLPSSVTPLPKPSAKPSLETAIPESNAIPTANLEPEAPPRILLGPENQNVNIGSTLTLECEADGNPLPHLWWKKDGLPVNETNQVYYSDDAIELTVDHVQESDAGTYVCVAENELGIAELEAEVVVVNVGPPQFLFEPYDLDAIEGTTIEMPCKAEKDDILQIKWQKDGRTITPKDKYRISAAGSLFVSNITQLDEGRYECSLLNKYGRATASGMLTVKKKAEALPGDQYVCIAIAEASREVDMAINQTIGRMFGSKGNGTRYHGDLFRIVRFPSGPAREIARAAEVYERALVIIRRHIESGANLTTNTTDFRYQDYLSPEYLDLLEQLSGCMAHRVTPNCSDLCFHAKYRSLDGTCNNYQHPTWGSSLTGFERMLPPIYENGFNSPIGWNRSMLYHGFSKPSARLVSTTLISTGRITPDDRITHMVMQWGQFLDHDLDHAIPSVTSESWDGVDCKKTCEYAAPCYPIEIPAGDPRIRNRRCIDFVRSSAICGSGITSIFFGTVQPREQINQLTAFIDASQVYGYTETFAQELRNLTTEEGLLRDGPQFPQQKSLLPFSAPTDGMDCRRDLDESQINCFTAGDIRVNEQLGLTTMHIIWLREHNRLAGELRRINPHWDGDRLYYESRKIVGALMQHITYDHWLPLVLGAQGMEQLGSYAGYDPTVNPSIYNEFATAAFRFGHSLINPVLHRLNASYQPIPQGHLPLHKAFFTPWRLMYEGGVDPLLRGLYSVPAKLKKPDQNLNTDLTERLFEVAHAVALDLAAINIQRSRDHAIPGYNAYRAQCGLPVAKSFEDLRGEISDAEVREKLEKLYGHPDNIDLWVGGILEDQLPGAKVGPLFACILVKQFRALRAGDRFWYENEVFKPEQLAQIKRASLARVICDNGDNITTITEDVFILPAKQTGGYRRCEQIAPLNLEHWVDCTDCSRHHKRYEQPYPPPALLVQQQQQQRRRRSTSRIRRAIPVKGDPLLDEAGNSDATSKPTHFALNENHLDQRASDDDMDGDDVDESRFVDDDMNEERIEGLEALIESFQKSMKQMRRKIRRLEQQCSAAVLAVAAVTANGGAGGAGSSIINPAKGKPHGHCVDSKGIKRLNNEIWMRDDCTKCECEHHQISCETERCAELICENGLVLVKEQGKCCPACIVAEDGATVATIRDNGTGQ